MMVSKASEIMRMTVIGSIGILFAWTAASALSAALSDTATVAPPKTLAVERNATSGWHVGYAEADITPASGEAMLAGFGQPRQVAGTLAPLRAQALAFEDGRGRRALLFTADVLGFGRGSIDVLRRKIEKAHGLPASAVCFTASHTHWGPAINYGANFAIGGLNVWYVGRLEETMLNLADKALGNLSPGRVEYGACEVRIGMSRRLPNERGEIGWGPNPNGSYDPHTPVLRITRTQSPKQLVLVGHACHPTSTGTVDKWSPDYPGAMRRKLESALEDSRALFVMGCGGDAKVVFHNEATGKIEFAADPQQSEMAGEKLAADVLAYLSNGELSSLDAELETQLVSGDLSLQEPRTREQIEEMAFNGNPRSTSTWWARQSLAYPDDRRSLRYEVQTWRLGDLTAVMLEGEVCADWGPFVRSLARTRHAMAIAYANEVPGYIPTARIIREGGYEGDTSHMAYFLPAPLQPQMEIELTALIEQALGRGDPGLGKGAPAPENKTNLLAIPYFALTRTAPTTDAEKWEMKQTRILAVDEWPARKTAIVANLQRLLGPLPGPAFRVPLDLKTVKEEHRDGYTQKTITYNVDAYDRVESYLLIPDQHDGKRPAILALHSTHPSGKDLAMGLGGVASQPYAHELAQRGYVVIVPDYWPMGHYRSKKYDPYQRGYASGAMKGVWNHVRAIDVLESLRQVDADRIGCIGHSLGGYNTIFLGVQDARVKVMVSNAGYNSFVHYAASPYGGGDLAKWSLDKHIRRIRTIYDNDPSAIPCDFPELIAALAPRPLLTIAPKQDEIFVLPGVIRCLDAARPVYELLGARDNLQARFPDGAHNFSDSERRAAYEFLDKFLKP
jgi:dienelactone hydrolase